MHDHACQPELAWPNSYGWTWLIWLHPTLVGSSSCVCLESDPAFHELVLMRMGSTRWQYLETVMHDSGNVLIPIPIPIPGLLWKPDSDSDSDSRLTLKAWFRFQQFSKCLIPIPIPIPVKIGLNPESIPIPESESCITVLNVVLTWRFQIYQRKRIMHQLRLLTFAAVFAFALSGGSLIKANVP